MWRSPSGKEEFRGRARVHLKFHGGRRSVVRQGPCRSVVPRPPAPGAGPVVVRTWWAASTTAPRWRCTDASTGPVSYTHLELSLPSATQSEDDPHETPPREVTPLGSVGVLQVIPPSVVEMDTAPPELSWPTATHADADGHEIAPSDATPAGRLTVDHVVPLSVVTMIGLVPTATQSEVDPHDTAARSTAPLGTVWLVQVMPPSVVATMVPVPTATHRAELGQETPESCGGGG